MKFIFSFFPFFSPLSDETDVQFIASETFCFIPEDLRGSPWGTAPLRLPCSSQPCEHRVLGAVGQEESRVHGPAAKPTGVVQGRLKQRGVEIPNLLTLWTL